jgi:RNA recognition motif-containing protein
MEDNVSEMPDLKTKKKKKTVESGIIYLSRIPTLMNVSIIRRYFENFGELGRVFLQPDGLYNIFTVNLVGGVREK